MIPILKKKQNPHQNQIKACTYRPHERKGGEKVTENRAEGNMAHQLKDRTMYTEHNQGHQIFESMSFNMIIKTYDYTQEKKVRGNK